MSLCSAKQLYWKRQLLMMSLRGGGVQPLSEITRPQKFCRTIKLNNAPQDEYGYGVTFLNKGFFCVTFLNTELCHVFEYGICFCVTFLNTEFSQVSPTIRPSVSFSKGLK